MKSSDLEEIERRVEESAHPVESIIHKAMKQWIAIEYYNKGISLDKIEFEKKIYFKGSRHWSILVWSIPCGRFGGERDRFSGVIWGC